MIAPKLLLTKSERETDTQVEDLNGESYHGVPCISLSFAAQN